MKIFSTKPFSSAALLLAAFHIGVARAACPAPRASTLSVTCTAQNGMTEEQHPKKHGVAPGTNCNDIPLPPVINWRECLQTVQFNFNWHYDGPAIGTLDKIQRTITNDIGTYPDDVTTDMVTGAWGSRITQGTALSDTYHQIVVDLCLQPITYNYALDVTVNGCTDTANYEYVITSNEGENGYSQFKEPSSADPNATEFDPMSPEAEATSEDITGLDASTSAAASIRGLGAVSLGVVAFFFASFL